VAGEKVIHAIASDRTLSSTLLGIGCRWLAESGDRLVFFRPLVRK